ncbi:MAG TPA: class I SAM-dependent methyltransferase [Ktedonobacterales bacterium]|jgi:SAM-dependent methyltransferase
MSAQARLRRGLFELLYKNRLLYWFASTVPFAGQWRVWQRLVLPRLRGHDVLEVGCGIGDLLLDMAQAGYRCQAIDRSPQMVAATRAKLASKGLADQIEVMQGNVQALPFGDATFDSVVSTFPTEYIADPAAVREIARVLRPGGRLIVVVGANLLPIGPLHFLLILFHTLVYGGSPRPALRRAERLRRQTPNVNVEGQQGSDDRQNVGAAPANGLRIPLEAAGLRRIEERVGNRAWEAFIIIGEKAEERKETSQRRLR